MPHDHHNDPTQSARGPQIPKPVVYLAVIGIVASWVPLALIARSRAVRSPNRPVHLILDMAHQPKVKTQADFELFADHRGQRPMVVGTVGREAGEAIEDDHFYRGYETDGNGDPIFVQPETPATQAPAAATAPKPAAPAAPPPLNLKYFDTFPPNVTFDATLLARGQDRYNINCAICHGYSGYGDGMIQQRVAQLTGLAATNGTTAPAAEWHVPRNFHEARIRVMPVGQIFNTITHGFGTMRGYADKLSPEDRWAIVAYVRALQASQTAEAK